MSVLHHLDTNLFQTLAIKCGGQNCMNSLCLLGYPPLPLSWQNSREKRQENCWINHRMPLLTHLTSPQCCQKLSQFLLFCIVSWSMAAPLLMHQHSDRYLLQIKSYFSRCLLMKNSSLSGICFSYTCLHVTLQ